MTHSERIAYHLDELETARTPSSESHIMPNVQAEDRAILDVGCGIGQTLVALELDPTQYAVGVDIEQETLAYGQEHFDSINFANCTAEHLPFANDSFDLVISRVALPYTNIPESLAEFHRVLKPGGKIWITLHPLRMTLRQLKDAIKERRVKDIIFRCYILFNGTLLHFFGKQIIFPFNGRYESFQTNKSISSLLKRAGFTELNVERGRHFLVTAKTQTHADQISDVAMESAFAVSQSASQNVAQNAEASPAGNLEPASENKTKPVEPA